MAGLYAWRILRLGYEPRTRWFEAGGSVSEQSMILPGIIYYKQREKGGNYVKNLAHRHHHRISDQSKGLNTIHAVQN